MCGRFTHLYKWRDLHRLMRLTSEPLEVPPSYNVAPTQQSIIVRSNDRERRAELATWGLRPLGMGGVGKGPAPINARAESVATSGMFRSAFKARRCIVPVSGFYEWQKLDGGAKPAKQPWYIHRADGEILLFAGLYEPGEDGRTFTIITTAANEFMATLHDRMPAVLEPEAVDGWLEGADTKLLVPAADGVLAAHRVSPRVNSPKNNDAALIEPASKPSGLAGLFDQAD